MKKLLKLTILLIALLFSIQTNTTIQVQGNLSYEDVWDDPSFWGCEGLTDEDCKILQEGNESLSSFQRRYFTEEDWQAFLPYFQAWADNMGQSYRMIEPRINDQEKMAYFDNLTLPILLNWLYYSGEHIGFHYNGIIDSRGMLDKTWINVFTVMSSYEHLYIFGFDEFDQPLVIYLDVIRANNDSNWNTHLTQNQDLTNLFQNFSVNYLGGSPAVNTSHNLLDGMTYDYFSQLTNEKQREYCELTPWYDIPDGFCSNKGMLPEDHWQAARIYGRNTGASLDESLEATFDPSYYSDPIYQDIMPTYGNN